MLGQEDSVWELNFTQTVKHLSIFSLLSFQDVPEDLAPWSYGMLRPHYSYHCQGQILTLDWVPGGEESMSDS